MWRAAQREACELPLDAASAGPALGLMDDATYTSICVRIDAGDTLLMFTDGLVEAAAPTGEEFGAERLSVAFAREAGACGCGDQMARALVEAARLFSGASGFGDDVCVLVLRCT